MAALKPEWKKKKASSMTGSAPSGKPRSRKGGKGRKRAKAKAQPREAEEQKSTEEGCTDGKEVLKRAAHRAAILQSTAITTRLAEKAAEGDAASAKMLVLLMDGKLLVSTRKPGELTYAQQLALDPPWQGDPDPWVEDEEERGVEREYGRERGTVDSEQWTVNSGQWTVNSEQ
ncbi:MAG: hypothetical protein WA802_16410 [Terracidiphilus sp.]